VNNYQSYALLLMSIVLLSFFHTFLYSSSLLRFFSGVITPFDFCLWQGAGVFCYCWKINFFTILKIDKNEKREQFINVYSKVGKRI